jgi:hypothetical protein
MLSSMFLATLALLSCAAPQTQQITPITSLRFEGFEALCVDPKDQGLARALGLVRERLAELPSELGNGDVPPGVVELVTELLCGSFALDVALGAEPIPGLQLPLLVDFAARRPDAQAAAAVADRAFELLGALGLELERPAADQLAPLPAQFPLGMGAVGNAFRIKLGSGTPAPSGAATDLLPTGARAMYSGSLEVGALVRTLEAEGGAPPADIAQMLELHRTMGLLEARYEVAHGSDAERQIMALALRGWAPAARELGIVGSEPLGLDLLRTVPVDATWASASSIDPTAVLRFYQRLEGREIDLIGAASEALGIDVEKELLATLGARLALYASDSTGAGGVASAVVVVELRDAATFAATSERLIAQANSALEPTTKGRVRIARRTLAGRKLDTLTFVGLPIPVEVCYTTTEDYAVFGLVPQAVLGAAAHIAGGGPSLLDNPRFRQQVPAGIETCIALQWCDTARLARDGYGMLAFACSALSNALRSPLVPERDAGLILPLYDDLVRDARGIVALSHCVGEDWISVYHADRSHLVNAAGVLGQLQGGPMLAVVLVGAGASMIVPQLMRAQENAKFVRMQADLQVLDQAVLAYRAHNDGRWPGSLTDLITPDAKGQTYIDRTEVPLDPWGQPYGYTPPSAPGADDGRVFCQTYDWR